MEEIDRMVEHLMKTKCLGDPYAPIKRTRLENGEIVVESIDPSDVYIPAKLDKTDGE